MMFEFGATARCVISKEIALKEITLFNLLFSIVSGKFKHHKYSENVNFEGTSKVVSILANEWGILPENKVIWCKIVDFFT